MAELFTISEISRIVALPTHTIRYYEKQFPNLLNVSRSKGGHRLYKEQHLVALKEVIRLLKEEKLSIRQTKQILGEEEAEVEFIDNSMQSNKIDTNQFTSILMNVLERLEQLSQSNARQQMILESLLKNISSINDQQLIEQIGKCKLVKQNTIVLNNETAVLV